MSSAIACTARCCARVSGHGRDPTMRSIDSSVARNAIPGSTFTPRRRSASPSCTMNSSSNAMRRCGSPAGRCAAAATSALRSGKCASRTASASGQRARRSSTPRGSTSARCWAYSSTVRRAMRRYVRAGTPSTSEYTGTTRPKSADPASSCSASPWASTGSMSGWDIVFAPPRQPVRTSPLTTMRDPMRKRCSSEGR